MDIQVSMLLILTVVAAIALIQETFFAYFGQGGKLSLHELKLFRVGGAVCFPFELFARLFRLKRLLFFIRAVCYSPVGRLPYKLSLRDKSCIACAILSRWGKSCIARAASKFGNVYGLTASDMAFCSVSEKNMVARRKRSRAERITGKILAVVKQIVCKMTETFETLFFADYIPCALIKNQKSKIENCLNACCSLPVWKIRPPKQGIWSLRTPGGKNFKNIIL